MSTSALLPRAAWTQRASLAKLVEALGAQNVRWVGGCVRDTLLGHEANDIDAATRHLPATVIDRCKAAGIRTIPTGIDHGTVTAVLADGSVERPFDVCSYGTDVFVDSPDGSVRLSALPRYPDPAAALAQGSLVAPMPGSVLRIAATVGDTVTAGQPLIWLEAMKMEHTITAPTDGVLVELNVEPGRQVEVGSMLARVDAGENEKEIP